MNKPAVTRIKRILAPLRKSPKKVVTLDMLSRMVGLYSDVLADDLEYFAPLVRMDPSLNLKDIVPQLEAYVADEEAVKATEPKVKRVVATQKELSQYPTISSFVYAKMTSAGGLVDPSNKLSDQDLHILKKLVDREVAFRKKAERKSARK
jgi:hypothetical protein